jgi:phosphocarrier protein HPr
MWDLVATREVTVLNPQGLHARPADAFARLASKFTSTIDVIKEGQHANGKSILDLLMLAAEGGTALTIVARGEDADKAVEALGHLMDHVIAFEESVKGSGNEQNTA